MSGNISKGLGWKGNLKTKMDEQKQKIKHCDLIPTCDINLNLKMESQSIYGSMKSSTYLVKPSDYLKIQRRKIGFQKYLKNIISYSS